MASWGVGHLDVFVLGADSAAYQKRFLANSWTPSWTSLGGTFVHEPVALSTQAGSIDAFAIGVDGNLWWKRYMHEPQAWLPSLEGWYNLNSSGSSSASTPGDWIDKPAVVSWGPDKINVLVVDRYHKLWRNYYNGWTWSGFVSLGGEHMHVPAVVSTAPSHLDIFSVGSDNVIYHKWFNGMVWGPHGVGGDWECTQQKCVGDVRAMTRPGDTAGIIDVFCVGWNSELYYKSGHAGGNGWKTWDYPWWRSLGVTSRSSPTIVALDTQRLQVFVTGSRTGLQSLVSNNGGVTWKEEATGSMTTPIASSGKRDKSDYLSTLITSFNHSTSLPKPSVAPLTRLTSG
jgi:hypothetical protein